MRFSSWFPAVLALAMPMGAVAEDGPIFDYTPPSYQKIDPPLQSMFEWQYYDKENTFKYNTTAPDDKNWIGVFYAFGGAPVNGTKVMDPLRWEYAPKNEGKVRIDTKDLPMGSYVAHYMAKDGYEDLVAPTEFSITNVYKVRFLTRELVTRPVREGEPFSLDVAQMASIAGDPKNEYWMIYCRGDNWAKITRDGVLYGTPTKESKRWTKLAIKVVTRRNLSYFLEIRVPVKSPGTRLVDSLKVMSLNMWVGGTEIADYHAKQIDLIASSNVDVVGLQETLGIHALRLAHGLGWWAHQTEDASIISRYPIVEVLNSTARTTGVRIALDGDKQQVIVWSAHLTAEPYGVYGFCYDKKDTDGVLKIEEDSGRTAQSKALGEALKPYVQNSDKIPVLLTGDFNAPSHLDYTNETAHLHCDAGDVKWPSSWYPVEAGMKDSFRELHPDPVADQGLTWSPIYLNNTDYNGQAEPKDRIDFVYYAGRMKPNESIAYWIDTESYAEPKHKKNLWPSDHKAVISTFLLDPEDDSSASNSTDTTSSSTSSTSSSSTSTSSTSSTSSVASSSPSTSSTSDTSNPPTTSTPYPDPYE